MINLVSWDRTRRSIMVALVGIRGLQEVCILMFRLRTILMMVSFVFAISAVGSASASAHEYLVNGAAITGSTSLPVLTIGGLAILEAGSKIIDCEKSHGLILILAGGRSFVHDIHFLNCITSESGCLPHSVGAANGLILLVNVPDLLVGRKPAGGGAEVTADEFKENPTTKEFITLKFLGTCTNFPETKVKGQVAGQTTGELTLFPTPELEGNSLEAFGKAAKFLAHFKNTLVGGGELTVD